MKPISRLDYLAQLEAQAKGAFKDHQLKSVAREHWRIKNPNNSAYWADIVVMGGRAIAVWGDIDACVFAYCSGATCPEDVVAWMARADVSYYGRQKAHIGMGGVGVDEFVPDVATYQLDQQLIEAQEEYDEDWDDSHGKWYTPSTVYHEAIERAQLHISAGVHFRHIQEDLIEELNRAESDAYEWVGSIGMVTSPRVVYALKAIERLHELLQVG